MLSLYVFLYALLLSVTPIKGQFMNPMLYSGNLPQYNSIYYKNCAPRVTCDPNSVYRTISGSCNNPYHPLWGSSMTPYLRLAEGAYSDGDHAIRRQVDGSRLPGPRELQLELFLNRSHDIPDVFNQNVNQFAQWSTHDITLLPPDVTGPENCCEVPLDNNTPVQCEAVILTPIDDPVFPGRKCMEFRRAMTSTLNFDCTITPQIPLNQASSYFDSSQLYGHTDEKAASIRTFRDGRLITDVINGQQFCPLLKRNASAPLCAGRDNVDVCFDAGDPRVNQHFGITLYTTMFTRFHNYVASKLQALNPHWTDEIIYQEARKYIGAASQIMVYRDYLPKLLGKRFMKKFGLHLFYGRRTVYDYSINPQLTLSFSGSAFRVPHNILNSKYYFMNKQYEVEEIYKLNEWMSISDPLVVKPNLDNLLRGMTQSPGRAPRPSYNFLVLVKPMFNKYCNRKPRPTISNFMFQSFVTGVQDLLAVDIQRSRDVGVPPYNVFRELCGYPRAYSFEDFGDLLASSDIAKLRRLYATVDDVDLLVAALLEKPCRGAMVGPIARCILADVFYRVRYGDRFFHDVEDQPGSFTNKQLRALRKVDLGHIFCATTGIGEVPFDIYRRRSTRCVLSCEEHLRRLDFTSWESY